MAFPTGTAIVFIVREHPQDIPTLRNTNVIVQAMLPIDIIPVNFTVIIGFAF